MRDIDNLEADLWLAADDRRANSKLTSSDNSSPVAGIIVVRDAGNFWNYLGGEVVG